MIIFDDAIAKELADAIKFAACELRAFREQRMAGLASKEDLVQSERRIIAVFKEERDKDLKSLTNQLARSTNKLEGAVEANQPK
jgi:hypothetical protein